MEFVLRECRQQRQVGTGASAQFGDPFLINAKIFSIGGQVPDRIGDVVDMIGEFILLIRQAVLDACHSHTEIPHRIHDIELIFAQLMGALFPCTAVDIDHQRRLAEKPARRFIKMDDKRFAIRFLIFEDGWHIVCHRLMDKRKRVEPSKHAIRNPGQQNGSQQKTSRLRNNLQQLHSQVTSKTL